MPDSKFDRDRRTVPFAVTLIAALALGGTACSGPSSQAEPDPEPVASTPAPDWERTLERVVPCIVSLRITVPRNFDTVDASTSGGTGFVVDKEAGLILTNRHLVMPGPVVAQAIFANREEVDLEAVYRDPVHDFGVFRFNPEDVSYLEVCELELAPDAARVGVDIRVVGNNAGEQISILSGTLARLDRDAPSYGTGNYNDFNTFYLQAASGTSGGSSGSPVLDIAGRVIALNAGSSRKSASSFFLPLDRVVRALSLLSAGDAVPRGTVQAIFEHRPFDELARLELAPETESRVRAARPDEKGMLVVDEVIPEGPAAGKLLPGDVVVEIGGELATTFVELEDVFDSSVGDRVALTVERAGESLDVRLDVDDLHALTPREYVEVSRAVIHPVSHQMAASYHVPVSGLVLVSRGFMFRAAGMSNNVVLLEADGQPLDTLDDLWGILSTRPDGSRIRFRWAPLSSPSNEGVTSVELDRAWYPLRRCALDADGAWPCTKADEAPLATPDPREPPVELPAQTLRGPAVRVADALVMVDFDIPYRVEAVWSSSFRGAGVVIDRARGLVMVDRDTVPIGLGDASVTFAGVHRVPAQVVFVHPVHNVAVVRYDPADAEGIEVGQLEVAGSPARAGDTIWQVGLDSRFQVVTRETKVDRVRPLRIGLPRRSPEYRDQNLDVMTIVDPTPSVGGVLVDEKGRAKALWASFHMAADDDSVFRGLPLTAIAREIDALRAGEIPDVRVLGVELGQTSLIEADELGLPREWQQTLADADPERLQVLTVERVFADAPAELQLLHGDLLLAVDGQPVTRFADVENAVQNPSVELDVLRDGEVLQIALDTWALPGFGVERVISWGGALLHEPHLEVATQATVARRGVYVALTWYGGPASRYDLNATRRIIEVDGEPTPDLDAFVAAVDGLPDGKSVRLRVLDMRDKEDIVTLRLDEDYWPRYELRHDADGWNRIDR